MRTRSVFISALLILNFAVVTSLWAQTGSEDQAPPGPAVMKRNGHPARTLTFPPVQFKPLKAERVVLSNGVVLYLLEDHELPLIKIGAMIKAGGMYEPPDKIGLAGLTGSVMRTGGTRRMSGDEVDEALEFLAAEISSNIGLDAGSLFLDVLAKDFDQGLELFSEILRYPAFDEKKLDLAKKQAIEGIRRRNDSPAAIASREFLKLVYGPTHPYARETTAKTVSSVDREDLVAFHQKYYHPNSIILGISGDFHKKEMIRKIEKVFGSWKKQKVEFPQVSPVEVRYSSSINYIDRDLTQTHLRMGHLGIRQDNPDFFALSILDDILGGKGFTSRLFQEIRTKRGLAYSVGTALDPRNFDLGVFFAYAQTKAGSTHQTISAILEEMKRIQSEPISDEELKQAKDSFLNSYVFSFSSTAQIVNRQVSLEYYGLPSDFLERFRDSVAKATREDIQRVARKYLHPGSLVLLAVGKQERFDRPLSTFGKVTTIILEEVDMEAVPISLLLTD
jgi:predicted Zn-dependent peptidase